MFVFSYFEFNFFSSKIAAFLDPSSFHFIESSEIEPIRELIEYESKYVIPSAARNASIENSAIFTQSEIVTKKSSKKNSNFTEFIKICSSSANAPATTEANAAKKILTIKDELNFFTNAMRNNKLDLCTFYHTNHPNIPILSDLARKFCISPATNVPSESKFIVAGYLNRKQRVRLSPKLLKYTMVLKS